MDIGNELNNIGVVAPAMPVEALLRESKQLQVTSLQLIRESKELQTALVLRLHLHKSHQQQLMEQRDLFLRRLSQNAVYQDKPAFLTHFRQR